MNRMAVILIILSSLFGASLFAESVITNPSERVIKLPIQWDDRGRPIIVPPDRDKTSPPRIVASCDIENLQVRVIKENGKKSSHITQIINGNAIEKTVPFVLTQKLTKEMLGQYAAAVTIAQELGMTEVDYIKIYLVDPQTKIKENKALIFFFDEDDEVVEKTIVYGNQWERCLELRIP